VPRSIAPADTILVVDDESTLRDLPGRVLTRAGFRVLAAEHGEHALRQARLHSGELNLVLTDVTCRSWEGSSSCGFSARFILEFLSSS
jgi:DNA-binding response OmpR family regulator